PVRRTVRPEELPAPTAASRPPLSHMEGASSMKSVLIGLTAATIVAGTSAERSAEQNEAVPRLDHVFVIVLENHNAFTSFGANGILDNPKAPHIQALAKKYNFASNYSGAWHPSLPNYLTMITGDFTGTDVSATGHTYAAGSAVGISDDDSPSVATDEPSPPANVSPHRWRVNLPSLAGQLVTVGKDWRAYLQNIPASGTSIANWPGDNNTAKLYAVTHNPFPYVAEIQDSPA